VSAITEGGQTVSDLTITATLSISGVTVLGTVPSRTFSATGGRSMSASSRRSYNASDTRTNTAT
jgi:hypothetical protein